MSILNEVSFILANSHKDFWFQGIELLIEQNDIGHSLYKFYDSVPVLKTLEDFVLHHQPYNLTFLTYLQSDGEESSNINQR